MKGDMKLWVLVAAVWVWILSASIHKHLAVAANIDDEDASLPIRKNAQGKAHDEPRISIPYIPFPINGDSNGIPPLPFSIIGDGQCLEANKNAIILSNCNNEKQEQGWTLLKDGTIRPVQDNGMCLTANDFTNRGYILILPCSRESSAYQVWQLKYDQIIVNVKSGLVFDRNCIVSLWEAHGGPNQRWTLKSRRFSE